MNLENVDFSLALIGLKAGEVWARANWHKRGMGVYLEDGFLVPNRSKGGDSSFQPCFVLRVERRHHQPGWLPSQADLLATDWYRLTAEEWYG